VTDRVAQDGDDQTGLLFRIYIPSERLYAAEAHRLLSLFRDWLITTRGCGVRQAGYRTASGEMYEFFADSVIKSDLHDQFDSFSNFLALCSENPSAAVDLLAPTRIGRGASSDLVARFSKEVRRLQIDLRHERERRILTIRHNLEEELVDNGVDLREAPSSQINALLERLVPGPTAPESLALLAAPWTAQPTAPVTVNINPQIISAMESTVIQNVQGTVHLGPQAKELLALIDRFGGQETGIGKVVTPHTLRHAFVTAALDAGVPLRDVQEAASHADPRTTMRYDRARGSLDRHATYIVAAYLAGAAR